MKRFLQLSKAYVLWENNNKRSFFHINLLILYNSKFILLATILVTNAVFVTRVHRITCIQSILDK